MEYVENAVLIVSKHRIRRWLGPWLIELTGLGRTRFYLEEIRFF
jgi:hypothetical protein